MSSFLFERLFSEIIAVGGIFAPLLKYAPRRPVSFGGWVGMCLSDFSPPSVETRGHFTNQVGGVLKSPKTARRHFVFGIKTLTNIKSAKNLPQALFLCLISSTMIKNWLQALLFLA